MNYRKLSCCTIKLNNKSEFKQNITFTSGEKIVIIITINFQTKRHKEKRREII